MGKNWWDVLGTLLDTLAKKDLGLPDLMEKVRASVCLFETGACYMAPSGLVLDKKLVLVLNLQRSFCLSLLNARNHHHVWQC